MSRHAEFTADRQARFLGLLAKGHTIAHAARAVGSGRTTVYTHRDADEAFRRAWDAAIDEGVEVLEEEVRRRAVDGVLKPVYQGGVKVGTIREYSDTLLIFSLKAKRPNVYRENKRVEFGGSPDGTRVRFTLDIGDGDKVRHDATDDA
jgi:hypothetical protein